MNVLRLAVWAVWAMFIGGSVIALYASGRLESIWDRIRDWAIVTMVTALFLALVVMTFFANR